MRIVFDTGRISLWVTYILRKNRCLVQGHVWKYFPESIPPKYMSGMNMPAHNKCMRCYKWENV